MKRLANLSALGYAAFALTLWINSMVPAGWFPADEVAFAVPLAMILGACVMAIAGIFQGVRGHTLDASVFLSFAGYWWILALGSRHTPAVDHLSGPTSGFLGWYFIVWAFWAFCLWLAACRDGVARMLFILGLCATLLAFALANWTHAEALAMLGGYLGLVTAILAIYIAAAEVINEIHGHTVLPLGEAAPEGGSGHVEPR